MLIEPLNNECMQGERTHAMHNPSQERENNNEGEEGITNA